MPAVRERICVRSIGGNQMKHALRKYISPCGSALFMVVSTMAALIVLVTAMYMSVLSSRQVQYATFDQEQAYVSSTSLADTVVAMFNSANSGSANPTQQAAAKLVDKITNTSSFKVGDTVKASQDNLHNVTDGLMDGYDIGITRLDDEKIGETTWYVYDIAVTIENNGVSETTHTFVRTKDETITVSPKIDSLFTATGYVPNDTIINSSTIKYPIKFDSEYVKISNMKGGGQALSLECELTCAGSLDLDGISTAGPVQTEYPSDWVIGNSMTVSCRPYQFWLGGKVKAGETIVDAEERGRIIVGGDFTSVKSEKALAIGKSGQPTDLYVLGDFILGETNASGTNFHGNIYVNGDLYIESYISNFLLEGNLYINGQIYCAPEIKDTINFGFDMTYDANGKWVSGTKNGKNRVFKWQAGSDMHGMTVSEASQFIDTKIGVSAYPKWVVEGSAVSKKHEISFANDYVNPATAEYNGYPQDVRNAIAAAGLTSKFTPGCIAVVNSACTISEIYDYGRNTQKDNYTIIFDTGAAGNTLVINLLGNRDTDGDGVMDTFTWLPLKRTCELKNGKLVWTEQELSGRTVTILTVGDGNLVLNVGEREVLDDAGNDTGTTTSVIYRSSDQEFFGHYAWYMKYGGQDHSDDAQTPYYSRVLATNVDTARSMIHYEDTCGKKCTYEETTKDGETVYKCTTHGTILTGEKPEKDKCYCDGRVEKNKFKALGYKYKGKTQVANVNIFLSSCSESAQIVLANPQVMGSATNNVFFGYIYAPYMTYIDNAMGGGLKNCGGLVVSDYVLSGYYTYVYAKPDLELVEVTGEGLKMEGLVVPAANRDWRIHGV